MSVRQKIGEKFSIILTEDIVRLLEDIKTSTGEETAPLLRKALRAGLPLVKSGGGGDVLTLDSELSKEVDAQAKRASRTRNSILLEAIRYGIEAVGIYAMINESKAKNGMDHAIEQAILAHHDMTVHPEKRAAKVAMLERAAFWEQVWDLVLHVPEARERKEAIEKLTELRIAAKVWPSYSVRGLRTSEIKWQIAMHEKYGHDSAKWPKAETEKRQRERDTEDKAYRKQKASPIVEAIPPALTQAMKDPQTRDMVIEQARKIVDAGDTPQKSTGKTSAKKKSSK